VVLAPGARFVVPGDHVERAAVVVSGTITVEGEGGSFADTQLVVFRPGAEVVLAAPAGARVMVIGGEPFAERRWIWWNFVSSSKERIEAAKADWRAGRFPPIAGETEFIPLPEDPPGVVWK
jgi:hypothetical protein